MPLPKKGEKESPNAFMSRCMGDDKVKTEYPDQKQRTAVCLSRACEQLDYVDATNLILQYQSKGDFKYKDPVTGEFYFFERQGIYKKNGRTLVYVSKSSEDNNQKRMEDYVFQDKKAAMKMAEKLGLSGVHSHKSGDNKTLWMPGKNMKEFQSWYESDTESVEAAEYQGRTVKLNKPFRTPDGPKKFSVYTKNEKGNVVKVNFGDPDMEIKRDDPERRKSFRARHNCDNPGPKWKARYWSCKNW